jgi:hypothetical protein
LSSLVNSYPACSPALSNNLAMAGETLSKRRNF